MLFKKIIIFTLIAVIEFGSFPVDAFARAARPAAEVEKEQFTTLITDAKPSDNDTITFTGQGHGVKSIVPALADQQASNLSAGFEETAKVHKLAKQDYRPNEEIDVVIENGAHKEYKTELIDAIGNKVALDTEEVETGAAKVITIEQPSSFRPGKYTLRITDNKGGVSEQDFSWGVLAINPDKSIYAPNETATLAIGVLDEGGDMVCDAQVELQITSPTGSMTSLSTDNGKIVVNEECKSHEFTLKPDYEATYQTGGVGVYKMVLKSQTKNGSFSITDSFEVKESIPFDVKRVTATRIYPPNTYPVTMEITANQDFEGTVSETVPGSFKIARPGEDVKTDTEVVDAIVSTDFSATASADILAPDALPKRNEPVFDTDAVIAYNTINTVGDFDGGKAVLGASIPGLGMPFSGMYRVTQEFGQSLVYDEYGHGIYDTFGMNGHDGIDFAMPEGTPLLAVDNGKVLLAGAGDYGTTIVIQHAWGRSYYGHLSTVDVKEGDEVQRGATIARSGNTGLSTGPHLHFGIKPDTNDSNNGYYGKVDPAYYLGLKVSASQVLGVMTKENVSNEFSTFNSQLSTPSTDVQILTWKISVKKGDKIKIGYNYLAPRISPQFYTLGPATFTDTTGKEVFHEIRKWQIASDALDYKFKRGTFQKSISTSCAAPCAQKVSGVGFKPKAVIFEWTANTAEGWKANQFMGMGFATSSTEERAVSYWSEDNQDPSDTGKLHSATQTVVIQGTNGAVNAQADFLSFDPDGFTLNWSTNDVNPYIIHYTAIGGADVSNAKVGSFTLASSGFTQSFTDPGFQPDFMMFLSNGTETTDVNSPHASMSAGFAAGPNKEGGVALLSRDAQTTTDTYKQQSTFSSILLLSQNGTQDAAADVRSFDSTGFTLNITNLPDVNTPIYYLAIKGGQYDVGAFTQPAITGPQSIYTGFRPSGLMTMAASQSAATSVAAHATLSTGGASRDSGGQAWCNDSTGTSCTTDWIARKKITFNNLASTENLENFPVLVKLSPGTIDYNKTQNSGQDIRFVDPSDPNIVLPHEIESWNESGTSYVWVKVPKIDKLSNTDHIWMYYGNASASDGQDTTNVWNENYKAIWHLKEDPSTAGAGGILDATSNNVDGTDNGSMAADDQVTGKDNGSLDFDGSDDYIDIPETSFDSIGAMTLSLWVKPGNIAQAGFPRIIQKGDPSGATRGFGIGQSTTGGVLGGWYQVNYLTTEYSRETSVTVSNGTWYHVTMVYNGATNVDMYVNGALANSGASAGWSAAADDMRIADKAGGSGSFTGGIDEIRISSTNRSAEWIEAEYRSTNDQMNTFGNEEIYGTSGLPYSQSSLWSDDLDAQNTPNSNTNTNIDTTKVIRFAASPIGGGDPRTVATAEMQSFDSTGFTVNWTEADSTTRLVLYWAAGSVNASQEDYRWYKNANTATPTTALEDENSPTILAKNKPYARLRTNISTGGNGLNASTQGFKLQYATNQAEAAIGGTTDWCNDTTGITCTAPLQSGDEVPESTTTDWCNDTTGITCTTDWSNRRKITFNNASASAALTDFPVMVKLDSTRIDYSKTQDLGQDIRFVDPANPTTVLPHQIETWNESGTSIVWVKVPTIDAQSTVDSIWMYYGNANSPDGQASSNVWDSNYHIVYHMRENSGDLVDSAGTAQNAVRGGSAVTQTAGIIGYGQDFNATGYTATSNPSLPTGDFAYEVWVKYDNGADDTIFMSSDGAAAPAGSEIRLYTATSTDILEFTVDLTGPFIDKAPSVGPWHHFAFSRSGSRTIYYHNGTPVNSVNDGSTLDFLLDSDGVTQCELFLGTDADANCNGSLGNYFDGQLDEFRVSNTPRSGDWVSASYLSGADLFNTYGSEMTQAETKLSATGWQYRKKIQFNNASASAALTDFPVMVKLDASRIDYNKTQDDGGDIRFVDPADNTTVLAHEIEKWNENGTSVVWVKVPSLAAGTEDYIWMYYGNPSASDGQSATSVWDSSHVGVWHLKEDPTGSAPQHLDSTSNNFDATANGTVASSDLINGQIDGARQIRTTGDARVSDNDALTPTQDMTLSGWIRISETGSDATLIYKNSTVSPWNTYVLGYYGGIFFFSLIDNASNYAQADYNGSIIPGKWYHLVGIRSGNTIQIYVNGTNANTTTDTLSNPNLNSNSDFLIGNIYTTEQTHALDEIRLSNDDRSTDWIEAEYLSETDQMNIFGHEQGYTISGASTVGWRDVADAWCNDTSGISCNTSWAYRKRITINNQSSSTNLTNFPVLVKLDASRIDYGKTQSDGDDIRFVDPNDPTTVLSHEIETWNESGESFIWIEVPQIDANSTSDSIWMYYGNESATSGQDGTGTWDGNSSAVWHLKESGTGTAGEYDESTGTNDNGIGGNGTASQVPLRTTGAIGYGQDFDGVDDYINGTNTAVFDATAAYTIEAWINPDDCGEGTAQGTMIAKAGVMKYYVCHDATGHDLGIQYVTDSDSQNNYITTGIWQHVVGVYSGGLVTFYLNGEAIPMEDNTVTTTNAAGAIIIGSDTNGASSLNFQGGIDEVRISATARTRDWIKAEYLTGSDQMNTFGNEETQTTSAWRYKDNAGVSNGATITASVLGTSTTGNQLTYQESNITELNPTAIAVGEKREFDFSLDGSLASNRRTYYFRLVNADGTPLTNYTRYPTLTVGVPNKKVMRGGKFFNYKATQPFTF